MMQLGIFARTFRRPTLAAVLDAVLAHNLDQVQFNMSCVGLPSMPDAIDPELASSIRREMVARGLTMVAVSGTFNMIHPNLGERLCGLERLAVLAASCQRLGTSIVTLCTGTRDAGDKWRYHPENASPEAWRDLLLSMQSALETAEAHEITLAIEPEVSNVVDSASKARRLLDEMASPRLKVVIDASNLFPAGSLQRQRLIMDQAFDLLGEEIVLAHAKDLAHDGAAGQKAAGTDLLDYDHYLSRLQSVGYDGPLLLHSLTEAQVPQAVCFLRQRLARLASSDGGAT
ncbi:MAG: sugar phosphate isomerase/epimerase [Anaerolineae bacterium]|jgi:sugar phosphate isomerase/epimerase